MHLNEHYEGPYNCTQMTHMVGVCFSSNAHMHTEFQIQNRTNKLYSKNMRQSENGYIPVPGGPYRSTPLGGWMPRFSNLSLWVIGNTTASINCKEAF